MSEAEKALSEVGFVRGGPAILKLLSRKPQLRSKVFVFRPTIGSGRGSIMYSTRDVFGSDGYSMIYYVADTAEARTKFAAFLTERFLAANPKPSVALKKVFTRYLHSYNLHWKECPH